jgi:ankyrin repeat protein
MTNIGVNIIDMFRLLRNHEDDEFMKHLNQDDTLDLNYRDNQENYLITYAIRFNKKDIVKLLLIKGSRYDVVDKVGRSILYDAIESDYGDILKIILDHAETSIGIVITDIRDVNGNIPLHYAIKFKNLHATRILADYGSKMYIEDEDGHNALHLAIKSKNISIVKAVTAVQTNFDAKNKKGDTALHMAINYQYTDIVKHILSQGADPNIPDNDSNFTPVHYAVGWNNYEILSLLIEAGAILDSQDVYGNVPLMYAVKERNDRCFDLIAEHKTNLNAWNIEGKIVLHEALDSYEKDSVDSKKYIDMLIKNSNVSHQDSHGNTCLHYLVSLGIWKDYIDILVNKKLNIFAKNSNSQMVVDFVEGDDYELLLDTVTESYMIYLRMEGNEWKNEIDKICSRDLIDLTDEQRTLLKTISPPPSKSKKSKKSKKSGNICYDIIGDKLRKVHKMIITKELECCQRSYPHNADDMITIDEGIMLDITTFTGSLLDVLIGLLYLLRKHSNSCSILNMDSSPNQGLCDFYRSMGLIMNGRCEFFNFEIVWIEYKLYMVDNFSDMFFKCVKSEARFIIIPVGIEMKSGSHANYLIYDKQIKELERFEPHGGTTPIGFNYNSRQLDDILEQYIESIDPDIKYIRPDDFIPKIGFQIMDSQETQTHRIGDPGGFCALWSIWYVDQRITYSHYSRERLIEELFSNIRSNGISYRNLIRNYSRNICQERDKLLSRIDIDINDWLNERYTNNMLDKFMTILNSEIKSCCS